MGKIIPEALLIIFSIAASGCQEPYNPGKNENIISETVLHKDFKEADKSKTGYFSEKKEVIGKADSLFKVLNELQDSLANIPVSQRNIDSFRKLNLITDKQAFLRAAVNEAKEASEKEWDFHHQKLKIIFNDIEHYFSSETREHKGE